MNTLDDGTVKQMNRPIISQYLDYRLYIKEYISYLQSKNKKYSQRWIAKKAGFNSPQLISMIISGHRSLSSENAQLLSYAFDLSAEEEEYFNLLIELSQTKNADAQMELINKIKIHFEEGIFKELPDTGFEYLRKWYYPVIREMVIVTGFQNKPEWIARALQIEVEEVKIAISTLLELGFLIGTDDGKLQRNEPSIKAMDYVSPMIMAKYHLQMLERSFNALSLPREFRFFDTLTVSISNKNAEKVRSILQKTIREIDLLAESSPKREDVYQLNLQFFSHTQGRLEKSRGENK